MKYVKIDNLRRHTESPFFSFPDLKDREIMITDQVYGQDEFYRELAIRLSARHNLGKTATNLLRVLLKEFMNIDLREGGTFATREIATKAGYKNPSSVYQGLWDLCRTKIVALKEEDGVGNGTLTIFPNPEVFGRKRCFIGEQLSISE